MPPMKTKQANVLRGLACGLAAAVIGFAIPVGICSVFVVVDYLGGKSLPNELREELFSVSSTSHFSVAYRTRWLAPGCAFVFGLAGFLNYTPGRRLGMVAAMVFVGAAAMAGLLLTGLVWGFPNTQPLKSEPRPESIDWRFALVAASLAGAYAIIHTLVRVAKRDDEIDGGITFIAPIRQE
jgi:hypothetical protein